jgi:hypothetical protein
VSNERRKRSDFSIKFQKRTSPRPLLVFKTCLTKQHSSCGQKIAEMPKKIAKIFASVTKNSYLCRKIFEMSAKEKLIARFRSLPKDFTWDELVRLFAAFGFILEQKGKTSGSRVLFFNEEKDLSYMAHKPHPTNVIKPYVMKQVLDLLDSEWIKKEQKED